MPYVTPRCVFSNVVLAVSLILSVMLSDRSGFAVLDKFLYFTEHGVDSVNLQLEALAKAYEEGAVLPEDVTSMMNEQLDSEVTTKEVAWLMSFATGFGMYHDATIGVYVGSSPWNLTRGDPVHSFRGTDPTLASADDGSLVLFCCGVNYITSNDGGETWSEPESVVFHPTNHSEARVRYYGVVKKVGGNWYMAHQSPEGTHLLLWVATDFPQQWEEVGAAVEVPCGAGHPTLFETTDGYVLVMFTGCKGLEIHYSPVDQLSKLPWAEHPASPMIFDPRNSMPSGNFFHDADGQLYRPGMDVRAAYGHRVTATKVMSVNASAFELDEFATSRWLIGASGRGLDVFGGHVVAVHRREDGMFVGAFDGYGSLTTAEAILDLYDQHLPSAAGKQIHKFVHKLRETLAQWGWQVS